MQGEIMDADKETTTRLSLADRFRKNWFPPAAVVGAFGAFVAAAFRVRPAARATPLAGKSDGVHPLPASASSSFAGVLDRNYRLVGVLGSSHPFRKSLDGIAVSAGKTLGLGDGEIRIFDAGGSLLRSWKAPEKTSCVAAGPDGRVYLGAGGRVEIFDSAGNHAGGFAAGDANRPAVITAVKAWQKEILVADAGAYLIRRFTLDGKQTGLIGARSKTGKFILPNRSLDLDVNAQGVVFATDTGRHQVTAWALDGAPLSSFGKFGMTNPGDFVGCCNPVNLAVTPDGKVVTAEKMVARVKVYESGGRLLAVIGPENFDPACTHIYLAVDGQERILAADPVRREIKIFTRVNQEA